ncbi:anti-sigma-I factor RsgI family protein [Paenibacillus gansuensis]|uniref:Anti-sigma factor domain-containing protein n=1 Tax=Paenibacillus gansuensis TaxID=306542 RepID=A0ABW5P765_9BACL
MNKGIVMQMGKKSVVVMTPDGQFKKVRRSPHNLQIGEEIDTTPAAAWRHRPMQALFSAAAAAVILFVVIFTAVGGFGSNSTMPMVAAYVTMDINPSIELGIDSRQNVVEARGVNDDGNRILHSISVMGLSLDEAADRIVDQLDKTGYLAKADGDIVISSTLMKDDTKLEKVHLAEKVKRKVSDSIRKKHPLKSSDFPVTAMETPKELRQEALDYGVSPAKLAFYLQAKHTGTAVAWDEIKTKSIHKIVQENETLRPILTTPAKQEELKQWLQDGPETLPISKSGAKQTEQDKADSGKGKPVPSKPDKPGSADSQGKSGQGNQHSLKDDSKEDKLDKAEEEKPGNKGKDGKHTSLKDEEDQNPWKQKLEKLAGRLLGKDSKKPDKEEKEKIKPSGRPAEQHGNKGREADSPSGNHTDDSSDQADRDTKKDTQENKGKSKGKYEDDKGPRNEEDSNGNPDDSKQPDNDNDTGSSGDKDDSKNDVKGQGGSSAVEGDRPVRGDSGNSGKNGNNGNGSKHTPHTNNQDKGVSKPDNQDELKPRNKEGNMELISVPGETGDKEPPGKGKPKKNK